MATIRPSTSSALLFLTALLAGRDGGRAPSVATAFVTPRPARGVLHRSERAATSSTSSDAAVDFPPPSLIDTHNEPPSLRTILDSLEELKSGSDLRGTYVGHRTNGMSIAGLSRPIRKLREENGGIALTPFAAHCFGAAFARWLLQNEPRHRDGGHERPGKHGNALTICIGRDPRPHGERLADAFARGAEGVDGGSRPVKVLYTNVATTPSMYEFVRADKCDAAVMITASHLPEEKNGVKFFSKGAGGLSSENIDELIALAQDAAREWFDMGILPPSSGNAGVLCSELVDFMPYYKETLKRAIVREVGSSSAKPLANLSVVVNPGNGAGCFFADVLRELGANVAGSIHLTPDGTFPDTFGVPNPEKKEMVEETARACEAAGADIGVMFDTDADRSGFVLPRTIDPKTGVRSHYEALNGNRMIALISTIFSRSSPGCTIVTDSTTSEALGRYLEDDLGLNHYRHVRGYANVIGKARELTEGGEANAEVAIEISGHCAMRENGYVDDGTYTSVKVIGLLARANAAGERGSLLDSISGLNEMPYEEEMRIRVSDGSLATTTSVFDQLVSSLKEKSQDGSVADWTLDEDNREGARLRLASGGHFMVRKSLHDPVISVQVEGTSREAAREAALDPLLGLLAEHRSVLDYSALENA